MKLEQIGTKTYHAKPTMKELTQAQKNGFVRRDSFTCVIIEDGIVEVKAVIYNGISKNIYSDLYKISQA